MNLTIIPIVLVLSLSSYCSSQAQDASPEIQFLVNDVRVDVSKGISVSTKGTVSLSIINEGSFKTELTEPIGLQITLASGIRPIKNSGGSNIRVLGSYKELGVYSFEDLVTPAKAGDRIIFELTNTRRRMVYSIDLI